MRLSWNSVSAMALILVAGATLGGISANAADLGGNCCADLEERVAELEATTARKGNRKVSLTVSGHVNEAVLFWDDGSERNAYVVTNNASRTRFRFVGNAKINADWSAGYLLEIGARYANSGNRNQLSTNAGGNANNLDIRHSAWYIDSKSYGRVWVGRTSSATDGIAEINLANNDYNGDWADGGTGNAFRLRRSGTNGQSGLSGLTVSLLSVQSGGNAHTGEGDRLNTVKYVSPTFMGFTVQAAWSEDDVLDAAVRYAGELGAFRVAAGIGYRQVTDTNNNVGGNCANLAGTANQSATDCNQLGMSASVMHTPTGLYLSGSYGRSNDENRKTLFKTSVAAQSVKDSDQHYYLQGGIEKNWFGIGKSTLFGEYFNGQYGATTDGGAIRSVAGDQLALGVAGAARISSYELTGWGLGFNQAIDAASMDLYVVYRNFDHNLTLMNTNNVIVGKSNPIDSQQFVIMGGKIKF